MPVSFSSSAFTHAWAITTPNAPSEVAARPGSVFYNVTQADGRVVTRAISTSNGSPLWGYDLGQGNFPPGNIPADARPFGPAYANGRVASMSYNSTSTAASLQVMNATTGGYISSPTYSAQGSAGSVPTPVGDELFFAAGYYGNAVYAANSATGDSLWRTVDAGQYGGYVMEGESVAVDQSYVYFFKAGALNVLARRDGALVQSIQNPFFSKNGLSYYGAYIGAPVLDGNGRIFTFSDNYSGEEALPIAAFSIKSDKPLWRTSHAYTGQPAVRGNRLYAVRSSSTTVDIIDVSTGLVTGSMDVGGASNITSNVVVTDSHLFVASATTTFAVDVTKSNFPVVWSTSFGGRLAVTPDNYLVISTLNGLRAVRLK